MSDERMPIAEAEQWARGYAETPDKERRREVQALLDEITRLRSVEFSAREARRMLRMTERLLPEPRLEAKAS